MFENFPLPERDRAVVGYRFSCDRPVHVMCLIHGIGEHAGRYQRMAAALAEKQIAVVSMDLRGHGISPGVRGDTAPREEVLADIDALILRAQEFYPGLPITLFGHSKGGNICLDYKARGHLNSTPAKYIVSAPWILLARSVPKPVYLFVKSAAKLFPKMTISQNIDEGILGNPQYVRPYKSDPLVHSKISLRCAVDGFDIGTAIFTGTHPDNGGSLGKPFLLMHGDEDKVCSVEGSRRLAEKLADTEGFCYIEWPGYRHEIHNGGAKTTGDEVIEKIGQFILE